MANLKGSKTEKNLKDAFAGESQANRRYLYFAAKADVEGLQRRVGGVPLDGGRRDRAMRMATWSISSRWATRPRACRSATRS